MMKTRPIPLLQRLLPGWLTCVALLLAGAESGFASVIPEPATVFYGRVIAVNGDRTHVATAGRLEWTLRRADGANVVLRTALFPMMGGAFSYRLEVPHNALASGLASAPGLVPLGSVLQTQSHLQITVDQQPAQILVPGAPTFDAAQAMRASTYRLDLVVGLAALDSDGDGIPDWWEERYGRNIASEDTDGDGWNNLAEFLNQGDPERDDRIPLLLTSEIQGCADGFTGVRLRVRDADSSTTQLVFTVTRPPGVGQLILRNAAAAGTNSDQVLNTGATFTQAEVEQGRLLYVHNTPATTEATTSFALRLRDEVPNRNLEEATVLMRLYRPSGALSDEQLDQVLNNPPGLVPPLPPLPPEQHRLGLNYFLSRHLGVHIWDYTIEATALRLSVPSSGLTAAQYQTVYRPSFGPDRRHVLIGGIAGDALNGGAENDVLIGGGGADRLRGGPGADQFVFQSPLDGNDVIEDFSLAENDVIDVARALSGASTSLPDYLRLAVEGTNSVLRINSAGTGTNFTNLVITVHGRALAEADLYDLIDSGRLVVGDKLPPPRVSISAAVPNASENGPQSGEFILRRSGSLAGDLSVNLVMSGSAMNGVDYPLIQSPVLLPAGQVSVSVLVTPFVDAITELSEVVEMTLQTGSGYVLSTNNRASIVIEDLAPQIRIEALEPVAVLQPRSPGVFLITRSGVLDRSLLVRLSIRGTATSGSDYDPLPTFVNLAPNQTTALIEVQPRTNAVLSGGVETVVLEVRSDASYRLLGATEARVLIVGEQLSFADWRQRHFPASSGTLAQFAASDPGARGISALHRFAFGLDPETAADRTNLPGYRVQNGHFTVEFRRPAWATGISYKVEATTNLNQWSSAATDVEPYTPPGAPLPADRAVYRATRSVQQAPHQFLRVRVELAP